MKKILLLLVFMTSFFHAQIVDEENEGTQSSIELGKASISFGINKPLEFYRLKCSNPSYAQFSGGESGFKSEVTKNLKKAIDQNAYSVNGTFNLIFSIDKQGKLSQFELKPEVRNSELFYRDLNVSFQNLKKQWTPATCDGTPVDSKLRLKVDFRTEFYDM